MISENDCHDKYPTDSNGQVDNVGPVMVMAASTLAIMVEVVVVVVVEGPIM